jgi:hypothetical protein
VRKIPSIPPEFDTLTVKLAVIRYTEYAIPASSNIIIIIIIIRRMDAILEFSF